MIAALIGHNVYKIHSEDTETIKKTLLLDVERV